MVKGEIVAIMDAVALKPRLYWRIVAPVVF